MDDTFTEYKDWCADEVDSNIEHNYNKAKQKLLKLIPYENGLVGEFLLMIYD
jgi:hypothetical protein